MLVNLLANALEATQPSDEVGVSWSSADEGATLMVWDTGPGFVGDPSTLFAPWYTTKERGTGLGLAITHRLVRAHGWTIQASRSKTQTVFTIGIRAADVVQSDAATPEQRTEVA